MRTSSFEKKISYSFKNPAFLRQALSHRSYAYENQQEDISDNEVLEFLGDSVLGLVVADYLCNQYPGLSEGDLSKLKSLASNTSALFTFAQNIKLDRQILLGKGEEKSGGRKKKTILAGAFEAVVAAVYLDGGIEAARDFLLGHLKPYFKRVNVKKFFVDNYKSALQEYLQKSSLPAPLYRTVRARGPNHKKSFIIEVFSEGRSLGRAEGTSKKDAEQRAAKKALRELLGRKIKAFSSDTFLFKKHGR